MKSIFKHICTNILEKKLRTVIIVLTIMLSTMVLFIGLSLNDIINDTYQTMLKGASGNANIVVSKDKDETDPFYKASDLDTSNIKTKERIDSINATGKSFLKDERVKVSLTGADLKEATQMELVKPIRAVDDFKLNGNNAIISQKTATDYAPDLGDTIEVSINDHTYDYKIAAVSETNGIFYSEIEAVHLIVSGEQLNESYGTENVFTSTFLTVPANDLDNAKSTLAADNGSFSIQKAGTVEANMRDEETFTITMIAAIVIIVLISAYVMMSLSKVIVSERMPVVGTFRSVGTSKRMMNRILALEFLLYGVIGAVLGLALAFVLLPPMADIFNEYKEFGVETKVTYNLGYIAAALMFGLFFSVIVSMFHIMIAGRKPLKDIILNTAHTSQKRSRVPVVIGVVLFSGAFVLYFINRTDDQLIALCSFLALFLSIILFIPTLLNGISKLFTAFAGRMTKGELTLGIKNIANNKMVANNCSMIIIVFLLLMMVGTTGKGLDNYVSTTMKTGYDIIVGDLEKDPADYTDLMETDGVADSELQYIGAARYNIKGDTDVFGVLGVQDMDKFSTFNPGIIFRGDAKEQLQEIGNGVVIDEYHAKRYALDVGDTIRLMPQNAHSEPLHGQDSYLDTVVAGVMDSSVLNSNKGTVIVNLPYFNDHFDGFSSQIALKVKQGVDEEDVKKDMSEAYIDTDITIHTFDELIASQKDTIDTLLNGIKLVILLGLIVGLLGITNNFIVSFMQRKKEYATLYSVCMSKGQLKKMLLYEMLMTFAAVGLIGFICGLAMHVITVKLLVALGLVIPFQFNIGLFAVLYGVVFILLALSAMSTIGRVKKLNMLAELRYE